MSTRRKELLGFLVPGLVQRLRRVLAAIEEQAALLDVAARSEVLTATRQGRAAVQVLRCLSGSGKGAAVRAAVLLPRLVEILAVPMADRGIDLAFKHSSREPPVRVDGTLLCETVGGALEAIAGGVPATFAGRLLVDLCAEGAEKVEILLELVPGRGQLPFAVDLLAVQQLLQKTLSKEGGLVVLMGRKLSLHLPTVAGEGSEPQSWST